MAWASRKGGRLILLLLSLLCDPTLVCLGDMGGAGKLRSMNFELPSLTREVRQFAPRHTGMPPVWVCWLLIAFWARPSRDLCSEMLTLGTH